MRALERHWAPERLKLGFYIFIESESALVVGVVGDRAQELRKFLLDAGKCHHRIPKQKQAPRITALRRFPDLEGRLHAHTLEFYLGGIKCLQCA